MSKRIPVNGFGMPLYSTTIASNLSKPKADWLYVNTSGDKMTGDLNMGGFQISNVETPYTQQMNLQKPMLINNFNR